jgi:hypothetical protein
MLPAPGPDGVPLEGVLAVHVPPQAPTAPAQPDAAPPAPRGLLVTVKPSNAMTSRAGCFDAFARALAQRPATDRVATVQVPAPGGVPTRHVLQVVDLLFRAGATQVAFAPVPAPARPVFGTPEEDAAWLVKYVQEHPLAAPGFEVSLDGAQSVGPLEPPPVRPVETRPAGFVRDAR